ncbi:MAG TPA: hypothetical protein VFB46_15390 [Gemmatimonadaceae bacterium]|nr:hypothetical protein [Gemmatimonadaceae bacterium]
MSDLVREPERYELWIQPQALRVRVLDAGEVLEAGEGCSAMIDDELARIGGADAHHEHNVQIDVYPENFSAAHLG